MTHKPDLKPCENTTAEADAAAEGRITIWMCGQPISHRLRKQELAEYHAAKERHYVVDRGYRIKNIYGRWCEAAQVPDIHVRPKKLYADVTMDLIFLPRDRRDLVPEARDEVEALCAGPGVILRCLGTYTSIDRVPVEDAGRIAATLWAIATAPRADVRVASTWGG
jgi:hypothetical protein